MEKTGFIYIWYDRKRKMFYIGSHFGTKDDGYICSSNRMRDAYRRRPFDFKRRIIETNITRDLLLETEHKWLSLISEHKLGKKYYNLRQHKWGHWSTDENRRMTVGQKIGSNTNRNEKIRQASLGRKHTEETKEKLRQKSLKQFENADNRKKCGNGKRGKPSKTKGKSIHSDEQKIIWTEIRKGNVPWNKGKIDLSKHSEESKKKMSESHKGSKKPWVGKNNILCSHCNKMFNAGNYSRHTRSISLCH
jgi:hypothetical protein